MNSFEDLVFPIPKAYFSPYPQEKILFLLVSIKLCKGPHAISLIISSGLSKNMILFELQEVSESLVMILDMLDNSLPYSLVFFSFFLYSLVYIKKLDFGFLLPLGRRE